MDSPADRHRLLASEQLLATLSHEIRTPLNGVLGMAGLLAETRLDPAQAAYLQTLRSCGEHLLALVNDVLDCAKLDARPVRLETSTVDVEALLQGVCELLSPRAYAGGIEIAWATQGAVPRLLADGGRLRQILFNLAGNAVKMTETGGVLLTATATPCGQARMKLIIDVVDTGPGIDPLNQIAIFNQFAQTEAGEAAGGAGLGLSIVRRLADAFEGQVGVRSRLGKGATFWFEAEFAIAPAAKVQSKALDGVVVGVVSPSATVRAAAAAQIEASGGTARLAVTLSQAPTDAAVVLIDQAAKPARGRLRPPRNAPALVLLAPEERRRIPAARAAGFAGYLIKPLRRASVVERIVALLAPSETADTPATPPGDERAISPEPIPAHVLLAEDNPVNALLARTLLTQAGCRVDRVATGDEALAAAHAAPYDLILMDLRMPGVDGLTAARRLRAEGVATPIVALTANAFEEDRRACLDAGMDDFLTKPLDPRALRAILMHWARPAPTRPPLRSPRAA